MLIPQSHALRTHKNAESGKMLACMTNPRNILIIRPSALGDVCRTVPVLVALKRRFPDAHIDWLVQDTFIPAIEHHPDLHEAIPFPRSDVAVDKLIRSRTARSQLRTLTQSLRAHNYDLVLDCQGLGRSGWFAWKTGAPIRIGFRQARELAFLALTRRVNAPRTLHTVDRMMLLAHAAGADPSNPDMRLYISQDDRSLAASLVPQGKVIVIAPTSRWKGKRWPADRFAQSIVRLLEHNPNLTFAIVGGKNERNQCESLFDLADANTNIIDLVGTTTIGTLMAIIQRASLVIANDSAALHMAVGFDRPLIALFGPTHIDLVGPYLHDHDVIQRITPDNHNRHKDPAFGLAAMQAISVEDVVDAALARLTNSAPLPTCADPSIRR